MPPRKKKVSKAGSSTITPMIDGEIEGLVPGGLVIDQDVTSKRKKLSPFDFINSITEGNNTPSLFKTDLFLEEKEYLPFMVNRGLSMHYDTILFANEMNLWNKVPRKAQYLFLKNIIRPRKRWSKWAKKDEETELLRCVKMAYQCSEEKGIEIISLLNPEQQAYICGLYNDF